MARFSIDTDAIASVSNSFSMIAEDISGIASKTESLLQRLSVQSAAERDIRESLQLSIENARNDRERLQSYASALARIAALYQDTEQGLVGGMPGLSGDSVNHIARDADTYLQSNTEVFGMNTSNSYSSDPVNLSNGNFVYEKTFFH